MAFSSDSTYLIQSVDAKEATIKFRTALLDGRAHYEQFLTRIGSASVDYSCDEPTKKNILAQVKAGQEKLQLSPDPRFPEVPSYYVILEVWKWTGQFRDDKNQPKLEPFTDWKNVVINDGSYKLPHMPLHGIESAYIIHLEAGKDPACEIKIKGHDLFAVPPTNVAAEPQPLPSLQWPRSPNFIFLCKLYAVPQENKPAIADEPASDAAAEEGEKAVDEGEKRAEEVGKVMAEDKITTDTKLKWHSAAITKAFHEYLMYVTEKKDWDVKFLKKAKGIETKYPDLFKAITKEIYTLDDAYTRITAFDAYQTDPRYGNYSYEYGLRAIYAVEAASLATEEARNSLPAPALKEGKDPAQAKQKFDNKRKAAKERRTKQLREFIAVMQTVDPAAETFMMGLLAGKEPEWPHKQAEESNETAPAEASAADTEKPAEVIRSTHLGGAVKVIEGERKVSPGVNPSRDTRFSSHIPERS